MSAEITLLVPYGAGGTRKARLEIPREVAAWLLDELSAAIGKPEPTPQRKPKRPVRRATSDTPPEI